MWFKYNHVYKIKSLLNRLFWRAFFSHSFQSYGKRVNVLFPENIIGPEYIAISDDVYIGYKASIIVLKKQATNPLLIIGRGTAIRPFFHVVCIGKISIGRDVVIADKVLITDNIHGYQDVEVPIVQQPLKYVAPVTIGDNAWIGENVCIIGASVGKHSVVGANAVVTRDIPDYSVAVGCPAKVVKRYDKEVGQWLCT